MFFADKYDLIVIGGGPAGSVSAGTAASLGVKTLLLEKDRDIGIPVRCAEGVAAVHLPKYIPINEKYIDCHIRKINFISPAGLILPINLNEEGVILNRKVFDLELAKQAARFGAQIITRANALGMERNGDNWRVNFEHFGKTYHIEAPLIVGADGVETRVGRWAGLKTNLPLIDIESCFQYHLYHPDIKTDCIDLYFGNEIAPGGYLWIFPKGGNCANVGMGVSGNKADTISVKERLDKFVDNTFPGASILSSVAGSVPSHKVPKKIVTDGVMLVGDAAHQDNPMTGGGILAGMAAGKFAGQTAAKAMEKGDFSEKYLHHYVDLWNEQLGVEQGRFYRLKRAVMKLDDNVLNRTAKLLSDIPDNERTLRKVFLTAFAQEPKLMLDIIKAFL
jgi:digeranylgeranylglycerophospholipid reductase